MVGTSNQSEPEMASEKNANLAGYEIFTAFTVTLKKKPRNVSMMWTFAKKKKHFMRLGVQVISRQNVVQNFRKVHSAKFLMIQFTYKF